MNNYIASIVDDLVMPRVKNVKYEGKDRFYLTCDYAYVNPNNERECGRVSVNSGPFGTKKELLLDFVGGLQIEDTRLDKGSLGKLLELTDCTVEDLSKDNIEALFKSYPKNIENYYRTHDGKSLEELKEVLEK